MARTERKLPQQCPSCDEKLKVKTLYCRACDTEIDGYYTLPVLATFTKQEEDFILNFIKASGSLKEMAEIMDLSYPTIRNYLDEIINKIKDIERNESKK